MKNNRENGSIILALVFLVFIFLTGSTLLTVTITNTRITRARVMKNRYITPMYQDLIDYLHHFRKDVFSNRFRDYPQPEKDYFCNEIFPSRMMAANSLVTPEFKYVEILKPDLSSAGTPGTSARTPGYQKTRVTSIVDVTADTFYNNNFHLRAETSIDILSGRIPLDYIPFFIQAGITTPEEEFFRGNNVINDSSSQMVAGDFPVQLDFKEWLRDTLQIPDNDILFWRNIREKLGLEPGDNPIDEGIYLMMDNGFLSAVFIQGDVDQLTFFVIPGAAGSLQGIRFHIKSAVYEIRYRSGEAYFECWDPDVPVDIVFREQIIVNGNVASIRQEGEAAFSGYTNIVLYVAGKSFIDSDLATESLQLNLEGVKVTGLTLSTGMEQLYGIGYGLEDHGVTVNKVGETNLDVSVIMEGKFTNKSIKLKLKGSLFCKDLENKGKMHINHRSSPKQNKRYFRTVDLKFIQQFLIQAIEEVSDE